MSKLRVIASQRRSNIIANGGCHSEEAKRLKNLVGEGGMIRFFAALRMTDRRMGLRRRWRSSQ